MNSSIRVGLYGSSLFLSAVAASLESHENIFLIYFPSTTSARVILHLSPTILLWQKHCSPTDRFKLINAGLWLVEIDELKNLVIIQHRSQSDKQSLPIQESADLTAWIGEQVQANK